MLKILYPLLFTLPLLSNDCFYQNIYGECSDKEKSYMFFMSEEELNDELMRKAVIENNKDKFKDLKEDFIRIIPERDNSKKSRIIKKKEIKVNKIKSKKKKVFIKKKEKEKSGQLIYLNQNRNFENKNIFLENDINISLSGPKLFISFEKNQFLNYEIVKNTIVLNLNKNYKKIEIDNSNYEKVSLNNNTLTIKLSNPISYYKINNDSDFSVIQELKSISLN